MEFSFLRCTNEFQYITIEQTIDARNRVAESYNFVDSYDNFVE